MRVSGPLVETVSIGVLGSLPAPRQVRHAMFQDAQGEVLDDGIALFFRAPTCSREKTFRTAGPGGMAVLEGVLQRCLELGCRVAGPANSPSARFSMAAWIWPRLKRLQTSIDASAEAARSAARTLTGSSPN